MEDNQCPTVKFYSHRAITIATYLGGPIAAGVLARHNFIALGQEKNGKYAFIIGIISTILIFIGILSLPDKIIDKIPNVLIPLIYTGIIYLIIEKYQGNELRVHKEKNGEFYSAWRATGISAICLIFLLGGIFLYLYSTTGILIPNANINKKYDSGIEIYSKNEEKALVLYTMLENESPEKSIDFIDKEGIPVWEENIRIVNELDKIKGLYKPLVKQDQVLINYCNLRIESYKLIRRSLKENTRIYDPQIENISQKIDEELSRLK